jgi:hypothetical protein
MHHGVVEHPVVPLFTDTPPRQDHAPIKAFSLLLGNPLCAIASRDDNFICGCGYPVDI